MAVHRLAEATWEEIRGLDKSRAVAILPVGSIEAHGPHLPLATDAIIAREAACRAARRLAREGWEVLLLPALHYTVAEFASGFPGTISISAGTFRAFLADLTASLKKAGFRHLCLANSHLDPAHLSALRDLSADGLRIHFVDQTRRRWARRLTDEFRSGSCHAGQYETSLVLASRPDQVRESHRELPAKFVPLADRIRAGARCFEEVGMDRAYCGNPAAATREEGERTYEILAGMIVEDFLEGCGET